MNCKTAVILAAGAGTRMKSELPKVLHEVCGRPMVSHVISQAKKAGAETIIAVIGHGAEQVKEGLKEEEILFALQEKQLGTGHAVMQAADRIPDEGGCICALRRYSSDYIGDAGGVRSVSQRQ